MPLSIRTPGQSPIDSSAINQFVQAFTGVMTDQPFTLANSLTVTNEITASSAVSITGNLTLSGVVSGGLTSSGALKSSSVVHAQNNSSTSSTPVQGIQLGSSGPGIYFGTGTPVLACTVGSLYLNAGGSSGTAAYLCIPNSGGASSSNWDAWSLT